MQSIDRFSELASLRAAGRATHMSNGSRRQAFTLIELLIVVAILLLLTVFVVSIFKPDGANKMRDAARISQSAFLGARDRALHAFGTTKVPSPNNRRGIRLMRDLTDPSLITSFAFVQPIQVEPPLVYGDPLSGSAVNVDATGLVTGDNVFWDQLYDFGAFPYPSRLKIPADDTGEWFVFTGRPNYVSMSNPRRVTIQLSTVPTATGTQTCEFEFGNELLPNHQPIQLPSGIVIDLLNSRLPVLWTTYQSIPKINTVPSGWVSLGEDPNNTANNRIALAALDIMFSPRGALTGAAAGTGPIYLLLNTIDDATLTFVDTADGKTKKISPLHPDNKGDKMVLSIAPQTGHVQTYPIDPTNSGAPYYTPTDLFSFAKKGSAAGQ